MAGSIVVAGSFYLLGLLAFVGTYGLDAWQASALTSVFAFGLILGIVIYKHGLFSLTGLISITGLIYGGAAAADAFVFEGANGYPAEQSALLLGLSFTFFGSFAIWSLVIGTDERTTLTLSEPFKKEFALPTVSWLVILPLVSLYILGLPEAPVFSLGRNALLEDRSTVGELLKTVVPVAFIVQYVIGRETGWNGRRHYFILFVLVFVLFLAGEFLFFGNRRKVISLLVAIIAVKALYERIPVTRVALVAGLGALVLMFSLFRNVPLDEWSGRLGRLDAQILLNPTTYEFKGFSTVGVELLDKFEHYENRFSYLSSARVLLPRILDPDRGLSPEQYFVFAYYPEIYSMGGGKSYNIVVEAFHNMGFVGVLVVPAIFAMFLRFLLLAMAPLSLTVYASLVYSTAFLPRMSLIGATKQMLIALGFLILVMLAVRVVAVVGRRIEHRQTGTPNAFA